MEIFLSFFPFSYCENELNLMKLEKPCFFSKKQNEFFEKGANCSWKTRKKRFKIQIYLESDNFIKQNRKLLANLSNKNENDCDKNKAPDIK